MGMMFLIAGIGVECAVRASGDTAYRLGAGAAIATAFLLIWVNVAVGFLGDEGNPANLMFVAVLWVASAAASSHSSALRAWRASWWRPPPASWSSGSSPSSRAGHRPAMPAFTRW